MADTNDDRLTRIEELIEITAEQVRTLVTLQAQSSRDITRLYDMANDSRQEIHRLYELWLQEWNEVRENIRRLYAAWPDHLRNGH